MRAHANKTQTATTRRQLALILFAALAVVSMVLTGVISGEHSRPQTFDLRHISLIALVAGAAFIAGLIVWHMTSSARRDAHNAKTESAQLRRNLAAADAIIRAEPQVLIFWEQGQAVRIVAHTLTGVAGLPEHQADILRFGQWLEPVASQNLKGALDQLFAQGRAFNIILRTRVRRTTRGGRPGGGRAGRAAVQGDFGLQAGTRARARVATSSGAQHPLEPGAARHVADAGVAARPRRAHQLDQRRLRRGRRSP